LATYSSSSAPSSSSISASLASVLLNDPQKVKKGEIHLENKKILFYVNDKYSINWFNSSGEIGDKVMASSTGSSFTTSQSPSSSAGGAGVRGREGIDGDGKETAGESYVIEIVYLKSVMDSKRSNMILLTYNSQIGKEWAEALTFVTASATKYRARKFVKENGNSLDYNDLRDEMRDSLASFHGLLPSPGASSATPPAAAKRRRVVKKIANSSSSSARKMESEAAEMEPNPAAHEGATFLSRLHSSVVSMDAASLLALLLDLFDIVFVSTVTNLYHDLTVNGNVILFPFFILLCPQRYQPPLFLLLVYVLLYSDLMRPFSRHSTRGRERDHTR
jgi:hypothetical protein